MLAVYGASAAVIDMLDIIKMYMHVQTALTEEVNIAFRYEWVPGSRPL